MEPRHPCIFTLTVQIVLATRAPESAIRGYVLVVLSVPRLEKGAYSRAIDRSRHAVAATRVLARRHHAGRRQNHLDRGPGRHVDDNGKSLAGNFEAQCHQTFRNIEKM